MAEHKKILVVDDDRDIREVMKLVLDEEGFEISEVANGHDVSQAVDRFHPDVILLDVMLGDMDGRDICKQLKSSLDTCDIPIIIVSATHGWHTMHEKMCRANDYLNKPFDIDDLISKVWHYTAA